LTLIKTTAGGLDEVFYRKATSGTNTNFEYLLTDALGSTWGLADQSGNVNTQYKYDIFGTTEQTGQASNNPLQSLAERTTVRGFTITAIVITRSNKRF
jgi:hypothetical protein